MRKLVRDLVPAIAIARSQRLNITSCKGEEAEQFLRDKLIEEAWEANAAPDGSLLEELADVLEVVRELAHRHGWSPEELEDARQVKAASHGRFVFGFVLNTEED